MALRSQLTVLLNKKMDRADFLKHLAVGVVALTGVGGVLRTLGESPQSPKTSQQAYGNSTYGGSRQA